NSERNGESFLSFLVVTGAEGTVAAYDAWFREFGIGFKKSGRDIGLIREIVATRHLAQHPKSIGLMHLSQRESDREKFRQPFFGHPVEKMALGKSSPHEIPWMLSITPETFSLAVKEVEEFTTWLEHEWRSGPKALPTSLRSPGEVVGEVIRYFRKPQVAGIRLTAGIAVGQRLRIINRGDVDFEQHIASMQLNGVDVQTATAGSEIG